ncbi:MAG: tRNA glutamyl-Q(34) synthetase GluQRS [Planctomycetes bacterium]|nr:tRNA glutamyl-Q(34) synthetase GluQRS [Planctomycetota bacterium]
MDTPSIDDLPRPSVGRLAPSPTGLLHVGHARSFLLAWWHARASGGRIVLRLEDLDGDRVKPGMAEQCVRDLAWLGLDWDGPTIVQSQGTAEIDAAVTELVARGLAYPCVCSRKEIEAAQSAPHPGQEKGRYPGTCRGKWPTLAEAERATGKPAAARLVVEPGRIELVDAFAGPFASDPWSEVGDFPIARRAGAAAYQLAVVVDDGRAGVTVVVRGDDLLSSTARQWLLQRALGLPHPAWHHVPLVVDEGGRRLAKRSDDLSLSELRTRGVPAERVVAWVARRSGLPDAEPAAAERFVHAFTLKNVRRTPLVLDRGALAELVDGR